ncbi:Filamentation induced by cAMP protein Fic [Pseudoalteromonas sp. SCSIO_11900]|uniref:Fic family protein n=1 Tax=unclassified Pseudoalteromonas TaxID=194690 RepID=UPI000452A083|nr:MULTISPECIES: Fic family protein [unclassified Pseudoalteromonas]EWS97138.1 Filamentation induced by cAMP protein Fic [Pseudoalteromonas sp. SCSIO_11900]TMO21698.1 Fic family protein [Pseudoalteromonas sp. S4741]SFT81317.1 Fic family protein [Pseudoalteromonas sp. DSM 26666]
MAKPSVERAPKFELSNVDYEKIGKYINKYDATDEKGHYLHWSLLKWRVPQAEAKDIWSAIKFKRTMQMKYIPLRCDKDNLFSYCTPHSMEAKLHKIIKIAGGSVGAVADKAASDKIQRKFLVSSLIMEEAITSAQLEGASTTREVAKKMLEDEREPVDEDERMILNNFFLLKLAEKKAKADLTLDLILEFHQKATNLTTENNVIPGEFREDNDIYVEDDRGEIAHQPPSFEKISERLQCVCDFANEDHSGMNGGEFIPPVIKAIILHFMIGYEHPFRDGNGRTARALFYWFMLKNEYELFRYISISKLLKDDPKGYGLSYMYTERDQNDLTYFIDFQLDVILDAFEELQEYLKSKTEEFNEVLQILENSKFSNILNFVQKDLVKKGTKEPGRIFTVKETANSYGISENTSRGYLNKLVDLKLLLPTKDGRTILYFAPSDLMNRLKVN